MEKLYCKRCGRTDDVYGEEGMTFICATCLSEDPPAPKAGTHRCSLCCHIKASAVRRPHLDNYFLCDECEGEVQVAAAKLKKGADVGNIIVKLYKL